MHIQGTKFHMGKLEQAAWASPEWDKGRSLVRRTGIAPDGWTMLSFLEFQRYPHQKRICGFLYVPGSDIHWSIRWIR